MFAHDTLNPARLKIILGLFVQVENHPRALDRGLALRQRQDRKRALAVRTPPEGFRRTRAARKNIDAIRDHEGRIKSDPELADQIKFFARIPGPRLFAAIAEPVQEGAGSRARDG